MKREIYRESPWNGVCWGLGEGRNIVLSHGGTLTTGHRCAGT